MALARITPETAVETVADQIRGFRETVDGAGRAPALVKLRTRADELSELVEAGTLEIEVLSLGDLHPQWTGMVAQWLGMEGEPLAEAIIEEKEYRQPPDLGRSSSVVLVRTGRRGPGRQVGDRIAPVLVIARGSTESPGAEWMEEIIEEVKQRPLTLIAAPKGSEWAQALAGLGSRDAWECKVVELETLQSKNLEASLKHPPLLQAGRLAGLWSASSALASMHGAFSAVLDNEGRSIASKKAALEQRVAGAGRGGVANPTEVVGDVRGYLQKRFETFQKGVSSRLDELVAAHDGTLTQEIEATVDAFKDFDYEKAPKIFVLTIPKSVQDGLIARTSSALSETGRADLMKMKELFREVETHLEGLIEAKGAPPVTLHFEHMSDRVLSNLVDRSIGFNRPYESQITRRGPMDYFMAARRYQMIFFMVFSAFGLSFIRSYREFTIPMGILLLSFGLLSVVNSTRKQSAETIAKELDKARDGMRNDLKRSTGEVQKGWEQAIAQHLSEQQTNAIELVDATVKSVTEQVAREAAAEKEILQKQLKTLETSHRKIAEGVKKAEVSEKDLEQMSAQLITFYSAMMRPAEAGAAPGAPATGMPASGMRPPAAPGAPGAPASAAMPPEAAAALKKLEELKNKPAAKPGAAAAGRPKPGGLAGQAKPDKAADPFAKLRQARAGAEKDAPKRPSLPSRPSKPSATKDARKTPSKRSPLRSRDKSKSDTTE